MEHSGSGGAFKRRAAMGNGGRASCHDGRAAFARLPSLVPLSPLALCCFLCIFCFFLLLQGIRLLFWFQEYSSRNDTVATLPLPSAQRLLRDVRQWSAATWRGLRLFVSVWVSVGLPLCMDRVLAHRFREFLTC